MAITKSLTHTNIAWQNRGRNPITHKLLLAFPSSQSCLRRLWSGEWVSEGKQAARRIFLRRFYQIKSFCNGDTEQRETPGIRTQKLPNTSQLQNEIISRGNSCRWTNAHTFMSARVRTPVGKTHFELSRYIETEVSSMFEREYDTGIRGTGSWSKNFKSQK